ncbi:MAG TPA: DUF5069 domain-containing protein [Candidatus Tumulicola sp.]|nr:DUF5069 domain-containing protein [Candidatus Tumulicola sp.]
MDAADLRRGPPRRWSERLDGIYWLPRLIDKTRAALSGTLGTYLYGQSPMDRGLLRALQCSHQDFAEIVLHAGSDDGVVAALRVRDRGSLERARDWSARLPARHRLFLWLIDVDDGYRASWLRPPIAVAANALSNLAKRLWPSRAAERAAARRP